MEMQIRRLFAPAVCNEPVTGTPGRGAYFNEVRIRGTGPGRCPGLAVRLAL